MSPLRSIGLKILSVAFFMAMASCIKVAAAAGIPPGQSVFFRSLFAIPIIIAWLIMKHDLAHGLETKNPFGHLWRGLIGVSAMACGFTALGLLPLPEVTAIGYAAPLLIVVFAAMFLGEEVRLFRLTAVFIGLIGVVIILQPRLSLTSFEAATKGEAVGAVIALMGAVLMALAQVFVRKLVKSETTATIVFYFSLSSSVFALITIPFGWVWPGWGTGIVLVLAGVLGGLGQILLTSAYRGAPTSVIAPFEYVSMLMALAVGYVLFDEIPTSQTLWGAGLIMLAGLFIIWRERQLGLERGRARPAMTPQG
ncbi:MAG: DMT family transporter [Pseudomonadota bacterium]